MPFCVGSNLTLMFMKTAGSAPILQMGKLRLKMRSEPPKFRQLEGFKCRQGLSDSKFHVIFVIQVASQIW